MEHNSSREDPPCAICGRPATPYGTRFPNLFTLEGGGFICVECARRVAPEQVEIAEAAERMFDLKPQREDG